MFLELEIGMWLIAMSSHWRYPGAFPFKNWWLPPMVVGTTALYPLIFTCVEICGPTFKTWFFPSAWINARRLKKIYKVFIALMVIGDVLLIHLFANILIGYHNVVAIRVNNS
jgi:hypothetical protein